MEKTYNLFPGTYLIKIQNRQYGLWIYLSHVDYKQ